MKLAYTRNTPQSLTTKKKKKTKQNKNKTKQKTKNKKTSFK